MTMSAAPAIHIAYKCSAYWLIYVIKPYHDFVEDGSGVVIHFVKFIDATYPIVTQHKGTTTYI